MGLPRKFADRVSVSIINNRSLEPLMCSDQYCAFWWKSFHVLLRKRKQKRLTDVKFRTLIGCFQVTVWQRKGWRDLNFSAHVLSLQALSSLLYMQLCNTALLPSAKAIAEGMLHGAKKAHSHSDTNHKTTKLWYNNSNHKKKIHWYMNTYLKDATEITAVRIKHEQQQQAPPPPTTTTNTTTTTNNNNNKHHQQQHQQQTPPTNPNTNNNEQKTSNRRRPLTN